MGNITTPTRGEFPIVMNSLAPFVERRNSARLRQTPLRRRTAQVRPLARSGPATRTLESFERRESNAQPLNIAATLELNLDRFPTKSEMLSFLRAVLDTATAGEFGFQQPDYVDALKLAVDVLEHSPDPVEAIATIQGYQAYMARQSRH